MCQPSSSAAPTPRNSVDLCVASVARSNFHAADALPKTRPPAPLARRLTWSADMPVQLAAHPGASGTLRSLHPAYPPGAIFAAAIGTAPLLCYGALLPRLRLFGWVAPGHQRQFPCRTCHRSALRPFRHHGMAYPRHAVWAAEVSDPPDASVDQQHDSCDPQGVFDPDRPCPSARQPVSQGPVRESAR